MTDMSGSHKQKTPFKKGSGWSIFTLSHFIVAKWHVKYKMHGDLDREAKKICQLNLKYDKAYIALDFTVFCV